MNLNEPELYQNKKNPDQPTLLPNPGSGDRKQTIL